MQNIFTGIKVLELTKVFSGPFATRMLADYGAEVIKIEHKNAPDDSRQYPPLKNTWSGYYEVLNRNKKGISLNLKNTRDLENFYRLIETADVFVENLTPSTKQKLKVDYATLKSINPSLIYASLSGKGQENDLKYYDVIAQAESGLMSLTGTPYQPFKIGPSVVDAFSGMTLAFGIASALFNRLRTNKGQSIQVSMLSSAMNLLEQNLIAYSMFGRNPKRVGNHDNAISPFGAFKTKDAFIVIAIGNNTLWETFSDYLKRYRPFDTALYNTNSKRLNNNETLIRIIETVFTEFTSAHLIRELRSMNIPCSKVNEMSDVIKDESNFTAERLLRIHHPKLGKCVVPGRSITFSSSKNTPLTPAPRIGKDNKKYDI